MALAPLVCEHTQMVAIHLGDEQRDVGIHTMRAGIAEHAVPGLCKAQLCLLGLACGHGRKDDPAI